MRTASLQLRAGLHWRASGALSYDGADPAERRAFPGSGRDLLTALGGSLVTARWLRFDLAARLGGPPHELVAGMAIRF